MTIVPRTGPLSASSALVTTSWYQRGKSSACGVRTEALAMAADATDGSYDRPVPAEKVRLRIGNLAKAVLVTGQAYQDPKDALNEFVSNGADEYAETGRHGGRIRIVLRRKG